MKKIIIALVLTMSFSVQAAVTTYDFCYELQDLSRSVMQGRQNGVPLADMFSIIQDNESRNLIEQIVLSAYDIPRYQTGEQVARTINNFADAWFLRCVRSFQ